MQTVLVRNKKKLGQRARAALRPLRASTARSPLAELAVRDTKVGVGNLQRKSGVELRGMTRFGSRQTMQRRSRAATAAR